MKTKVGLAAAKATVLMIDLNVEGCGIVAAPVQAPSGQLASIYLFQAAMPEQACHFVALLLLPNLLQLLPHSCASSRAQSGLSMIIVKCLAGSLVGCVFLQL